MLHEGFHNNMIYYLYLFYDKIYSKYVFVAKFIAIIIKILQSLQSCNFESNINFTNKKRIVKSCYCFEIGKNFTWLKIIMIFYILQYTIYCIIKMNNHIDALGQTFSILIKKINEITNMLSRARNED